MIKGIYTAASGMQSHSRALDIAGNNLANAATAGFKRDELLFTSFGDALSLSLNKCFTSPYTDRKKRKAAAFLFLFMAFLYGL